MSTQPVTLRSYDGILDKGFGWTKPLAKIPIIGAQIPNLLSISRALAIVLGYALHHAIQADNMFDAKRLMVLAAILVTTDAFDGYMARKMGLTSNLGAALDPLFDKVYAIALFYFWAKLAADSGVGSWPALRIVLFAVVLQEVGLVLAACYGFVKKYEVKANNFGKYKFNVQIAAISVGYLGMIGHNPEISVNLGGLLLFIGFWLGLASLITHWNSRSPAS